MANKNIKKIQRMLKGEFSNSAQSGYIPKNIHANRKVGERYFDHDDKEWEKTEYGRTSISKLASVGLFSKQCKDCKKNCSIDKRNLDTFNRMSRCFYCQIDYENMLKEKRIGEHGNKWYFWVKLNQLRRWDAIDREIEQYVREDSGIRWQSKELAGALANMNIEDTIRKNKKLTGQI